MSRNRQDGPVDVLLTRIQGRTPAATSLRASWAPMKPPPPVIRTRGLSTMCRSRPEHVDWPFACNPDSELQAFKDLPDEQSFRHWLLLGSHIPTFNTWFMGFTAVRVGVV